MNAKQLRSITRHGEQLLAIFTGATERDPVALCKKLRRLESRASAIALRLCNGPEFPGGYDEVDQLCDALLAKVDALLNFRATGPHDSVFINRDPRGYALKIRGDAIGNMPLHRDWGGDGIVAPEFGKND